MKILVSACLLGLCCRYDGQDKGNEKIKALSKNHVLVPLCPEQLGGLPTPRDKSERTANSVCTEQGKDVTAQFTKGAQEVLKMYKLLGCDMAILKSNSPSCGVTHIYDGSFQGKRIEGQGVTASLLLQEGIFVVEENSAFLDTL